MRPARRAPGRAERLGARLRGFSRTRSELLVGSGRGPTASRVVGDLVGHETVKTVVPVALGLRWHDIPYPEVVRTVRFREGARGPEARQVETLDRSRRGELPKRLVDDRRPRVAAPIGEHFGRPNRAVRVSGLGDHGEPARAPYRHEAIAVRPCHIKERGIFGEPNPAMPRAGGPLPREIRDGERVRFGRPVGKEDPRRANSDEFGETAAQLLLVGGSHVRRRRNRVPDRSTHPALAQIVPAAGMVVDPVGEREPHGPREGLAH
jgi:hypothetical protein